MHRIIPRRGDFRMRAHINPFNTPFFPFPPHPTYVDWKLHFPLHFQGDVNDTRLHCNTDQYPCTYSHPVLQPQRKIDFLDVGCGYGGLLISRNSVEDLHLFSRSSLQGQKFQTQDSKHRLSFRICIFDEAGRSHLLHHRCLGPASVALAAFT